MIGEKLGSIAGKCTAGAAVMVALGLVSCDDTLYVSFTFVGNDKALSLEKKGIKVNLRLSAGVPVEHELHIVNKTERQIRLDYRNIGLSVEQTSIVVPVARNYDHFIGKINRKATLNCNKSENPYSCVDAVARRGKKYIGKGFSFGAINPGEEERGYIVFDFPRPGVNNYLTKRFKKELRRGREFFGGQIQVEVKMGAIVESFSFPVSLRIYDRPDEVPLELKSFWQ
ncbi:MAG: hypothetical protein JXA18_08105 [Chitinispirillaceae bacterium]|nr:hypothetical protein [Chitinispirillaceae bacterium]